MTTGTLPEGTNEPKCAHVRGCGWPSDAPIHTDPRDMLHHAFVQPSAPNSEPTPRSLAEEVACAMECGKTVHFDGEDDWTRVRDRVDAIIKARAAVDPSPLPTLEPQQCTMIVDSDPSLYPTEAPTICGNELPCAEHPTPELVYAPWSREQVTALNAWQGLSHVHPFTCGAEGCRAALVATERGWICQFDDYTQTWAHMFMADAALHPASLLSDLDAADEQTPTETDEEAFADAAEALWGVVANASGGDWTLQADEWRQAAARARDKYHAALNARRSAQPTAEAPSARCENCGSDQFRRWCNDCGVASDRATAESIDVKGIAEEIVQALRGEQLIAQKVMGLNYAYRATVAVLTKHLTARTTKEMERTRELLTRGK